VTLRFGTFTFDRARRQVRQGDDPVHLTRKAFDLLALLVDEAPRVVPKAELHERLWPGTFVSDSALVGLVKELRRVLREPSAEESYIRTSHGVGYAFTGDTEGGEARSKPAAVQHWVVAGDRRIPLQEGENLIGRDPSARIWLDAAGVSRHHARIVVRGSLADVEDLSSKNGTLASRVRVTGAATLRDGDTIEVGPVSILYRASDAGMSTETTVRRG
jgi:DNA-binding winged helix-turn-helix (wHTH) protein